MDHAVINRGFGGSLMKDCALYAERIVIPYKPRIVVLFAGGNDLNAKATPAEVMQQYEIFDAKVLKALPLSVIVHISINPTTKRVAIDKIVRETNRLLAEHCKGNSRLIFIDSYSKMLGDDQLAKKEWLSEDGVHLNSLGYTRWKEIIKPVLLEIYPGLSATQ